MSEELEVQKESLSKLERELESIKESMNNLDKRDKKYLDLKEEFDQKVKQLLLIDSDIKIEDIPTPLLQAISKAYIIKNFIAECLGHAVLDDQVSMQLTITELVLCTVIKRHGKYYEIEGIGDIHNVVLGFAPTNNLDFISEDCMTTMYRKLGVGYIPISE